MRGFILFTTILLLFNSCKKDNKSNPNNETETYDVIFTFNWNSADYPLYYPNNAHFSKVIGWTHQPEHSFLKVGTTASEGIKQMAQSGKTSPLDTEITDKINTGEGLTLIVESNLGSGTGIIQMNATFNNKNSAISLVTMIAPSPDWYVAVINVNLIENGEFVTNKIVNAHVYDAGTDSGVSYTSTDSSSAPQAPISLFVNPPLGDGISLPSVIATVQFIKQ